MAGTKATDQDGQMNGGGMGISDEKYEIAAILDWRYSDTQTQARPDPDPDKSGTAPDTPADIPKIELLINWKDYPDAKYNTWEDEDQLQLTVDNTVWKLVPHAAADDKVISKFTCNAVLVFEEAEEVVPLRIVGHSEKVDGSESAQTKANA